MDSSDDAERRHDPAAALELVKQAHRAPRTISAADLADFQIQIDTGKAQTAWMQQAFGMPVEFRARLGRAGAPEFRSAATASVAGRWSKDTPLEQWLRQREKRHLQQISEHLRRTIALPSLRRGKRTVDEGLILQLAHRLLREGVRRKGRNGLVVKIREQLRQLAADSAIRMLARSGKVTAVSSRMTISRILEKHGV